MIALSGLANYYANAGQSGYTSFGKDHKDSENLDTLVALLCRLNECVPRFSPSVVKFSIDQSVQRPLQDIFSCLIDTSLFLVAYLRGVPLGELENSRSLSPQELFLTSDIS